MIRGVRRVLLRFVYALLVALSVWGFTLACARYEAHGATSMLAEAERVQVGDSEASVLPLVRRYSGFRWTPEPLPPKEQWIDKDEYEYQSNLLSDYKYEFATSPFGTVSHHTPKVSKLVQAIQDVIDSIPLRLRGLLGLRNWGAIVELSVRNRRIQSVSAMTLVEGRTEWLGYEWELAERMPHSYMPARAYAIGAAHLTMPGGGGEAITNFFTPAAQLSEQRTARSFNTGCLTSIRGCEGLCDIAPHALKYLKQNPDAAWNIIPPKCH